VLVSFGYLILQMSPEDFIKNNRGIDDGKDIPEEYLRSLFERISRNEIKMKDVDLEHQQVQAVNPNRLLGLDSILNIVVRKRGEDSHMGTSDDLIRRMQEEFREKARKTEYVLQYFPMIIFLSKFYSQFIYKPYSIFDTKYLLLPPFVYVQACYRSYHFYEYLHVAFHCTFNISIQSIHSGLLFMLFFCNFNATQITYLEF
jgi:hypothetical protein